MSGKRLTIVPIRLLQFLAFALLLTACGITANTAAIQALQTTASAMDARARARTLTMASLNILKGYRDGTGAFSNNYAATPAWIANPGTGRFPLPTMQAKSISVTVGSADGGNSGQFGIKALASNLSGGFTTGRTLAYSIELDTNSLAAAGAQRFRVEFKPLRADGGTIGGVFGPTFTLAQLATLGTTGTANGITGTVLLSDRGRVVIEYVFTVPADATGAITQYVFTNRTEGTGMSGKPPLIFHAPVLLADAERSDPTYVYADTQAELDARTTTTTTTTGGGSVALDRLTGGTAGPVVSTATGWADATTSMTTALLTYALLDASNKVMPPGTFADTTGWGLLPNTTYYLTDGTPYRLTAVPVAGVPDSAYSKTVMNVLRTTARADANGKATQGRVLEPMPQFAPITNRALIASQFPESAYNTNLVTTQPDSVKLIYARGPQPQTNLTGDEERTGTTAAPSPLTMTVGGVTKHPFLEFRGYNGFYARQLTDLPPQVDGDYLMTMQIGEGSADSVSGGLFFRGDGDSLVLLAFYNNWFQFQQISMAGGTETTTGLGGGATGLMSGMGTIYNVRVNVSGANLKAHMWAYDSTKSLADQVLNEPTAWGVQTTAATDLSAGVAGVMTRDFRLRVYAFAAAVAGQTARYS